MLVAGIYLSMLILMVSSVAGIFAGNAMYIVSCAFFLPVLVAVKMA